MSLKPDRRFSRCVRASLTAVLAAVVFQSGAASATAAKAARFEHGLLWKVESPGTAPSYLFGTVHSDDPRVTQLAVPVHDAFAKSTSFTMEIIAGGDALVQMAEKMFFNDGRTLPEVLGERLFNQAKTALVERGLPTVDMDRKKPWAIVMALAAPRPRTGLFLDLKLQMQVTVAGKPVHALETVGEQLAVFDDLTLQDQVALLEGTLAMRAQFDRQFEEIIEAYLERDLKKMMAIAERHAPESRPIEQKVMQRLLTVRNYRMADRMIPRLKEGNAFIAVGAGHLPGSEGVLALLHARGYRISRVY